MSIESRLSTIERKAQTAAGNHGEYCKCGEQMPLVTMRGIPIEQPEKCGRCGKPYPPDRAIINLDLPVNWG